MREKTACFTGHREMNLPEDEVQRRLKKILDVLISRGIIYYGCGGAWGFDFLAAKAVIEAKQKDNRIKLILVLPCKDQEKKWQAAQKRTYDYLKTQADKIVYTSESYFRGCMHKRNRHLVDNSKICISLLERQSGGTFYTFKYAMNKGLEIYNLMLPDFLHPIEYQ